MGGKIHLSFQVLLVVFAYIVTEQRQRHNQWQQMVVVLSNNLKKLRFLAG